MDEPIENLYFSWLYSKVSDPNAHLPQLRYCNLFEELHQIDYIFLINGDDNRAQDGIDLRTEFLHEEFIADNGLLFLRGCSVLEMLIAFSRKASFETDESSSDWFWVMISNLGLSSLTDAVYIDHKAVRNIIDTFVWRTYDEFGCGGLFPLRFTERDQRDVEVWYQFNEYLVELGYDK